LRSSPRCCKWRHCLVLEKHVGFMLCYLHGCDWNPHSCSEKKNPEIEGVADWCQIYFENNRATESAPASTVPTLSPAVCSIGGGIFIVNVSVPPSLLPFSVWSLYPLFCCSVSPWFSFRRNCSVFTTFSLSIGGHLGGFHVLAIVRNAVMKMGVHISKSRFFQPP